MTVKIEFVRDAEGQPTRVVLRRVYENAIPPERLGAPEFADDVPWAIEGEDLDVSHAQYLAKQQAEAVRPVIAEMQRRNALAMRRRRFEKRALIDPIGALLEREGIA